MRKKLPPTYGLLAEFDDPHALLRAAESARDAGYEKMDAYSPFPIHGLSEAVGFHRSRLSTIVLCGGIFGALGGFFMQWFAWTIHWPLNIGGKPPNSWPAFIPITFELTVLFAAFSAVFGMIALNGLPQLYHPVFNIDRFERASRDGFFLCIESDDPRFDTGQTRAFLEGLNSMEVNDVPW